LRIDQKACLKSIYAAGWMVDLYWLWKRRYLSISRDLIRCILV
jgi:hypothetical protein